MNQLLSDVTDEAAFDILVLLVEQLMDRVDELEREVAHLAVRSDER